jgi:hypothetical protein
VPGGLGGLIAVAGIGFAGVAFAFVTSFFPPSQLPVGSPATYVGVVTAGFVVFIGLPILIHALKRPSWVQEPGQNGRTNLTNYGLVASFAGLIRLHGSSRPCHGR